MKQSKRQLERRWKQSNLTVDREIYSDFCKFYNEKLELTKCDYYKMQLENYSDNDFFYMINVLSNPNTTRMLPDYSNPEDLANKFASFFVSKIQTIRDELDNTEVHDLSAELKESALDCTLLEFKQFTLEKVGRIIMSAPSKTCKLDPIPTSLLKQCVDAVLPIITDIVNMFLSAGVMPACLKRLVLM